jgi:hypothetical protein
MEGDKNNPVFSARPRDAPYWSSYGAGVSLLPQSVNLPGGDYIANDNPHTVARPPRIHANRQPIVFQALLPTIFNCLLA